MRLACDFLAAALAGALAWACLYAAPVPPPRRPAPPPAPLEAWDLAGRWEVDGGRWHVELCPTGAYRCHSQRDALDRGEASYLGSWSLRGAELTVRERPAWGGDELPHAAAVSRRGRDLQAAGGGWMAGRWRRR